MPDFLRFGQFRIDLRTAALYRDGMPVAIQRQPFQILALLLERPGELVTREEVCARIWPEGTFVDFEHGLNTAIRKLRRALGETAETPIYVETIPRRGYRFIAPVEAEVDTAARVGERGALLVVCIAGTRPGDKDARLAGLERLVGSYGGDWLGGSAEGAMAAFAEAEASLRCALAAIRDTAVDLEPCQIGVALGHGALGREQAMALCHVARPGEVVCTVPLADRLAPTGDLRFREIATGLADPAAACAVERPARAQPARSPFVGRREELGILVDRLARARGGHGGVVLVTGEAGIGKTRLLEELVRRARGAGTLVLAGRCAESEFSPPYEPFAEAFGRWARDTGKDRREELLRDAGTAVARAVPGLRDAPLGAPALPPMRADEERFRIHEASARLLEALCKREPVLLLLDDLHWADGATLALLGSLARLAPGSALLLVAAYRDSEVGREHPLARTVESIAREPGCERVALAGLGTAALRELAEGLAGGGLSEAAVSELRRATDGNPFFVRELLEHLRREGRLARDEHGAVALPADPDALGVPGNLQALVGARLGALSDDASRLLTAGAAFDGRFSFELAWRAADLPEESALDALDEALEAQLLRPGGELEVYDFAHAILRQAVYAALSPARAQRLHRRIAEQAEALYGARALEHAALIAGQYQRGARLPGAERGGEFALAAAAQAERVAAVDEQARFLRIALELLGADDARRARAEAALGLALVYAKAADEGLRAVTQAAERLAAQEGSPAAAAYLAEAAEAFWLTGFDQLRGAIVAAQGLRHAGQERGPTWARLAVIEVMAREAMDSARPGIPTDTPLRREISQGIIEHLHALGGASAAETWRIFFAVVFDSRAQALAALPDEPASLAFLGGAYRRALDLCRGQEAAAAEWGGLRSALLFQTMVHLETALGELDRAEARLARLASVARRVEAPPVNEAPLAASAATLALCRGAGIEDALAWLERTLPPVDLPPARFFLAPFRALAALCCAWLGRSAEAGRWLALVLPMIEAGPGWPPNFGVAANAAAETLWVLERREDAELMERNLRAKSLAPDFRYTAWDARLSLARLCALQERWDEAAAAFAASRAALDEQGARPLRAIADHDEALALCRRGRAADRARAAALLSAARGEFAALGMRGWVARADGLAREIA